MDEDTVAILATDPERLGLGTPMRAIVRYALELTRRPGETTEAAVTTLREAGLSDVAIHDVASITAYFNFVNRTASGLGVELEDERTQARPPGRED